MSITPDQLKIMIALRDASALRREPGPITPDGIEKWWSLGELETQGLLNIGPYTSASGRTLRRLGLVAGRTQHTVTRYSLTGGGGAMLARMEQEAGVTELRGAELAQEQAERDMHVAVDRYHIARADLNRLRGDAGHRGSINVLLDYLKASAR
jgi:hypothetical protein